MKCPNGEIIWTTYYNSRNEIMFVITSKSLRDFYYLYEIVNGSFKKLGKAKTPLDLEEKFKIFEKL